MKKLTRRGFLKFLGLGTVAIPLATQIDLPSVPEANPALAEMLSIPKPEEIRARIKSSQYYKGNSIYYKPITISDITPEQIELLNKKMVAIQRRFRKEMVRYLWGEIA